MPISSKTATQKNLHDYFSHKLPNSPGKSLYKTKDNHEPTETTPKSLRRLLESFETSKTIKIHKLPEYLPPANRITNKGNQKDIDKETRTASQNQ